jgi:gliding-associated putative ABC transporter substrate-binding component GldG
MKRDNIFLRLFVTLITVILINVISYYFFFRLDFTADKRFTLSEGTKDILTSLNKKVIINAYFSEDLPTQLLKSRQDFEDLLVEYEKRAEGNLSFNFINPNKNDADEQFAQTQGIRPVMVNVSERDQATQLRAYMGATVEIDSLREVVPLIQPGESAEYAITTAVKKMITKQKPKVAFLQGHQEYSSSALAQVMEQISILYNVENFTITDTSEIPISYKTLIIIDPKDSIPPSHFTKLNNYLKTGGNIFLAYSNVFGSLQTPVIQPMPDIGVRGWLEKMGIIVADELTIDAQSRRVVMQEQQGPFVYNKQIRFPYFPIIKNFENHPVTKGIEAAFFPFITSIKIVPKNTSIKITPLAASSDKSGLIKVPAAININKEWSAKEFTSGPQIVAVALQGALAGEGNAKMIVIPNGKFSVNTEPGQEELNADNVSLTSNAIDWLSDDTGLIELRTKGVLYRPLDPVDDTFREMIKYANVFLPVLIILVVSGIRRYSNLKKRRKLLASVY